MSSDNGDRQMIENATREQALLAAGERPDLSAAALARAAGVPKEPVKPPSGCVERSLSMRDRNMIVGACTAFVAMDGHKGFKDQQKLKKVRDLLAFDETLEYFAMIDDATSDAVADWNRARAKRKLWLDWKAGILRSDDLKRQYPNLDLETEAPKPAARAPEATPAETRGPERVFQIPAKLDVWIEAALRAMDWSPIHTDGGVEVSEKYGIEVNG